MNTCTQAKATLTQGDMEFSIQLFKVSESEETKTNNNCIIVEIQRTNGSSIQFHKTARTLLQAAKEKKKEKEETSSSSVVVSSLAAAAADADADDDSTSPLQVQIQAQSQHQHQSFLI